MVNWTYAGIVVGGLFGFLGSIIANWYFLLPAVKRDTTTVSEKKWTLAFVIFIVLIVIAFAIALYT
jgi:membrane protease YdiL (CAAX protease family)